MIGGEEEGTAMERNVAARRHRALSDLIARAETAIMAGGLPGADARRAAGEVFDRCRARTGTPGLLPAARLPVCDWLEAAFALGRDTPRASVARAFATLAPDLRWTRRKAIGAAAQPFRDGHANAMLCGPGGLEERDDVWIGATLMAPAVTYVAHDHPPAEVYLPLTPGEWWNARMDWSDPGAEGLIYNPPGIRHAMRSGKSPFLALWFLPI